MKEYYIKIGNMYIDQLYVDNDLIENNFIEEFDLKYSLKKCYEPIKANDTNKDMYDETLSKVLGIQPFTVLSFEEVKENTNEK